MVNRGRNLFYAVDVAELEELSGMQEDISDALSNIIEAFEELRSLIDSYNVPTLSDLDDSNNPSAISY